jgi:hypothetical protein
MSVLMTKHVGDQLTEEIIKLLTFIPLNAKSNPICHLLALLGAHHILNVSRLRVNKRRVVPKELHTSCAGNFQHVSYITWMWLKEI